VHYIEGRATVKDKHTVSINGKDYTVGSQYRPTVLQTAAVAQCVVLLLLNTYCCCYIVQLLCMTWYSCCVCDGN